MIKSKTSDFYSISTIYLLVAFSLSFVSCSSNVGPIGQQGKQKPYKEKTSVKFDSGTIKPGDSFTYTYGTRLKEGAYPFYDAKNYLNGMTGAIEITEDADYKRDTLVVEMKKNTFKPSCPKVLPGTTIKWVNKDDFNHNVSGGEAPTS
jgi:plastocyanin